MSVASEINRIKANIADAYDEAEAKGATMPLTENSANLADTVASIPQGSTPTLQSKTVTPTESQQSVTPDSGYDGLSKVTVTEALLLNTNVVPTTYSVRVVPPMGYYGLKSVLVAGTPLEAKTVTPTAQQQVVTPTAPNIGLSSVTVGATPQPTLITKQITENGTYSAEDDNADGYSEVTVEVPQDPYEVMNAYITNTLTRLRLNHVPTGFLIKLRPGSSTSTGASVNSLQSVEFPDNQDELYTNCYGYLINLMLFDGGYTPSIGSASLRGCIKLESLILRKNDGVVTLFNINSASFSNANLRVYVPPTLIEDYKNATNWNTAPEKFRNLYFANSDSETEQMLNDSTIPNESMIVCDYNETYVVKE